MIYKKNEVVWSLTDSEIKGHIIEDIQFVTWIQKLKIDGQWQPADDFYPSKQEAMEADERAAFRMHK